jgi:hypothetical protein
LLSKKGNIMTHKEYTTPLTNINILAIENLMITASPGVGGDYDPSTPIGAKPTTFDYNEDEGDDNDDPYYINWSK